MATFTFSFVVSGALGWAIGLRVSVESERIGLDQSLHVEAAYQP